ncbi:MAG: DUF302 domain-containing protein [Bryobacteraceae bacterium]|jgi:uncharacterized protein (DUF302 family)
MPEASSNGIISIPSTHDVDATVGKLKAILDSKGVKIFAVIDHSGEAQKAGMPMRNTKLVIFGSPKAGTPLMLASPTTALDLPMKILVWEDSAGKAWVTYNSVEFLRQRHNLTADLAANIAVIDTLAAKAAE